MKTKRYKKLPNTYWTDWCWFPTNGSTKFVGTVNLNWWTKFTNAFGIVRLVYFRKIFRKSFCKSHPEWYLDKLMSNLRCSSRSLYGKELPNGWMDTLAKYPERFMIEKNIDDYIVYVEKGINSGKMRHSFIFNLPILNCHYTVGKMTTCLIRKCSNYFRSLGLIVFNTLSIIIFIDLCLFQVHA